MGKFSKLKKVMEKSEMKEEDDTPEQSSAEDSSDSETEGLTQEEIQVERKRAVLWTNRERVLILCSRGADARTRHLINDLKDLMPHAKGDSKLDQQKSLTVLNEIAEMKNCTKIMYFESRKLKDTYLWISNVEGGPSVKFLVHNVHTMMEMKMSGNCLKASRPILSFDSTFDDKPHLTLIKHSLMQTFSTANHHPRSQPFVDHVFSFSVTSDGKIWFRNFQIVDDTLQLQEIGPRFVLETIRIFSGSFEGAVLYDNPDYESPNSKRRNVKELGSAKFISRQLHHKAEAAKFVTVKDTLAELVEDPAGEIFDTDRFVDGEARIIENRINEKPLSKSAKNRMRPGKSGANAEPVGKRRKE